MVCLSALLPLCLALPSFGARSVAAAAVTEETGELRYEYVMTDPTAVCFSESGLFFLDGNGRTVKADQFGMTLIGDSSAATKLAASPEGRTVTDTDEGYEGAISIFYDEGCFGAVKAGEIIYNGNSVATTEDEVLCGAAFGGKIYTCEKSGGIVSVFSYDEESGTRALIRRGVASDGDPVAISVLSAGEIYYATDYSLFRLETSGSADIGGITSLSNDGEALYYTTRSGKLRRYVGGVGYTVFCAAESVSAATRKNFAVFAEKGSNKVTLVRADDRITAEATEPTSAAIDYDGNVYVAENNRVSVFSSELERLPDIGLTFDENILQIGIDMSDVENNALYVLTESGKLLRASDGSTVTTEATRFVISPDGAIYALKTSGDVALCGEEESVVLSSSAFDGAVKDIAADGAGNVFCATENGLYKNDEKTSVSLSGVREIDISFIETTGINSVCYGDIIVVSDSDCSTGIIKAADAGVVMYADDGGALDKFIADAESGYNAAGVAVDIRPAEAVADIYARPAESPAILGETSYGAYVIVMAEYPDTDYVYAIVETTDSNTDGVKGFVNKRALGQPLPTRKLYDNDNCYPTVITEIYKYPSAVSPPAKGSRATTEVGKAYLLADFVSGYADGENRTWYHITFSSEGKDYDGYIPAISAKLSPPSPDGSNRVIVPDGFIDAPAKVEVKAYMRGEDGKFTEIEGVTIPNRTEVQLIDRDAYKRGDEYTEIVYCSDAASGATRKCFVRTEYITLTVGTWYQVVMFIVAIIVVIAIVIIIAVAVKKKKKIE